MTNEELLIISNLRLINGKYWLPPSGNDEAKLMIVSANPLYEEARMKRLYVGEVLDEVEGGLNEVGLSVDDCWMTSIVKYKPAKSKPSAAEIEECLPQFLQEVEHVKPKLIITLGGEAFKAVMQKNIKYSDFVGEIVDSPIGKVMPVHSPGFICGMDPTLRPGFKHDFKYAGKFLNDTLDFTPYEFRIISDPKENLEYLTHYMESGKWTIAYDAEWLGKKYTDDEVMYTFQYSCEPHRAIILNISDDGKTENRELLDTMKVFLENPKADRVGWNIRSDDKRLRFRGFNIPDETLGFDGMKAVAYFDSRWPKGLETGIKRFTNYKHYYVPFYVALKKHKLDASDMSKLKMLEPELFYDYCGGDAVSHFTACNNMRDEMNKHLPKGIRDYYFETYLPLSNYLLDIELTGLPIDIELMDGLTNKYMERYTQIREDLVGELANIGIADFSPNSSQDKIKLLYTTLKLDAPYYTKANSAPKPRAWYKKQKAKTQMLYKKSSNGKSLASLRFELEGALKEDPNNKDLQQKHVIVKKMLQLGRVGVFANKFFSKRGTDFVDDVSEETDDDDPLKASYWNALHPDGRIHADFYECLDPFRSSSKVNVQNPAAKVLSHIPDCFEGSGIEVPANIRKIFYPGDPDWYYGEADCAGADLAIMASLSRDPAFIADMRSGSFHTRKMREYFRNDKLTKENVSNYVTAKAITFRVSYTAELLCAAIPIQAEIYAESGNWVPLEDIEYALNTWNNYKHYMAYRESCKAQAKEEGYIENARGFRLYFEKSENFTILAGWSNESLAFPVASELALFMWEVSIQMKNQLVKDKVWMKYIKPCNTIHDAHHWLIHKDLMKDNYFPEICRIFFTDAVKLASGDNIGVELVVADRWKGDNVIYKNETVWNEAEQSWKWKSK